VWLRAEAAGGPPRLSRRRSRPRQRRTRRSSTSQRNPVQAAAIARHRDVTVTPMPVVGSIRSAAGAEAQGAGALPVVDVAPEESAATISFSSWSTAVTCETVGEYDGGRSGVWTAGSGPLQQLVAGVRLPGSGEAPRRSPRRYRALVRGPRSVITIEKRSRPGTACRRPRSPRPQTRPGDLLACQVVALAG
jgi:hypothetical protein